MDMLKDLLKKQEKRVITYRRDLHKIPEPGFEEYKTSRYIARVLKKTGIPFREHIAETGIVGEIEGGSGGGTVLLRADMDGIPVPEERTGLAFSSGHKGMMHACGHDTHTAMLLCAGSVLFGLRKKLKGKVILVFQPAEEGKGGGREVVESGAVDFSGIDAAISQHIWGPLPAGTFGYIQGPAFAMADEFVITVTGKGGHGSMPQKTRDPITAAAHIIHAVNDIISRRIAASEKAVVSFGSVRGGSVYNVIPDTVVLKGTVRAYRNDVRNTIKRELKKTALYTAKAAGVKASCEYLSGYPVLCNNTGVVRTGIRAAEKVFGPRNIKECEPVMGAEDFSFFLEKAPGAMFFLGGAPGKKDPVHHSAEFDIDESVLIKGVEFLCRVSMEYLYKP